MQDSRKFVALFCDDALSWKFVLAILSIFLLGFASFYPQIVTVSDELGYVSQAQVFAGNGSRFVRLDPLTRMGVMVQSGQNPPGTALMMAPFVWIAGWKAAFMSVALCLVAGVYLPFNSTNMNAQKMRRLAERYDEVTIVILDRSDTPFWRKEFLSNAAFVASLGGSPALLVDRQASPTDRLRIWQLRSND